METGCKRLDATLALTAITSHPHFGSSIVLDYNIL